MRVAMKNSPMKNKYEILYLHFTLFYAILVFWDK